MGEGTPRVGPTALPWAACQAPHAPPPARLGPGGREGGRRSKPGVQRGGAGQEGRKQTSQARGTDRPTGSPSLALPSPARPGPEPGGGGGPGSLRTPNPPAGNRAQGGDSGIRRGGKARRRGGFPSTGPPPGRSGRSPELRGTLPSPPNIRRSEPHPRSRSPGSRPVLARRGAGGQAGP